MTRAPPAGGAPLPRSLTVASRRSPLARIQALRVGELLRRSCPGLRVEYLQVSTEGDRLLDRPLPEVGGKGLFTAELERLLLAGEADLAVHSLKDLPTATAEGLDLVAIPEREDCRDVLIVRGGGGLDELGEGARVGTSSVRRQAMLRRRDPGSRPCSVRGNIHTRLRKLDEGEYDGLILAAAGLLRLGLLESRLAAGEATLLPVSEWLPAPGQGALGIQGRAEDAAVRRAAAAIDDRETRATTAAERALLDALGGGCQLPVGARARRSGASLVLGGIVLSPDGRDATEGEVEGSAEEPEAVGRALAEELRRLGVGRLLEACREI
ncbi:MAG: hydroxymethylbilane synthase [Gemmatimonadota bacterium]